MTQLIMMPFIMLFIAGMVLLITSNIKAINTSKSLDKISFSVFYKEFVLFVKLQLARHSLDQLLHSDTDVNGVKLIVNDMVSPDSMIYAGTVASIIDAMGPTLRALVLRFYQKKSLAYSLSSVISDIVDDYNRILLSRVTLMNSDLVELDLTLRKDKKEPLNDINGMVYDKLASSIMVDIKDITEKVIDGITQEN
jgi:hypothetical protein